MLSEVITDPVPVALSHENITAGVPRITLDVTDSERPPKLVLCLLQPLVNSEMLATCGDPSSRCVRMVDRSMGDVANEEFLSIAPLSQAWRRAMANSAPRAEAVLDMRLPVISEGSSPQICWDTVIPRNGGLVVRMQEVIRIAITIATDVRMRVHEPCRSGVSFHGKVQYWRGDSMKTFQGQLMKLAK
ncbi:hypothetical protein EJ08DRAFT_737389 [Tothia fuscella]|uniref:Uncharacterized protein n=1 Tax=Tothia fuscella TaxID=1048955 RepID=A0A9P4NIW2_9PEZI|nr:hypothetical protein EJ08DRAFT_737389 [Tothia fuscella]